ncbi:MAG: ATP-binding protein [Mycobacterium sp.]
MSRAGLNSTLARYVLAGVRLQLALRLVLATFIACTLIIERPAGRFWLCLLILAGYLAIVAVWATWAFTRKRPRGRLSPPVAFAVLLADVTVVGALTAITGIAAPHAWTSDVLSQGLFIIPIIAAAQLSAPISALMAVPTLLSFVVANWINQAANEEPWPPIFLHAAVLVALAAGSVVLSYIQRSRIRTIRRLLEQRTRLLDDMLGLEKREQTELSERLHDGALQSVLAARYDLAAIRAAGSNDALDRMDSALTDSAHLLRDVVRELHPEVLNRSGLRAAVEQLAQTVAERADLTVDLDVKGWPEGVRTDADPILFGCARELTNNVVKHARASTVQISLQLGKHMARLHIRDDGVGMADVDLTRIVEEGHIGLAAIRTKVQAADGRFDIASDSTGTELTVTVPVRRAA